MFYDLLNLVVTSMLGKCKGQTKAYNKKRVNAMRNTTRNTQVAGFLGEL